MWSLVLRFLPSLTGGLSAFLNPWVLLTIVSAFGSGVMWEVFRGSARLDAYQAKAEALAAKQDAQTAIKIADHKRLKEKADETYRTDLAQLSADLNLADERLRAVRAKASQRLVPAAPGGAAGNQRICADREALNRELNAGIDGAFGRYASKRLGSDKEGQRGISLALICKEWAKGL